MGKFKASFFQPRGKTDRKACSLYVPEKMHIKMSTSFPPLDLARSSFLVEPNGDGKTYLYSVPLILPKRQMGPPERTGTNLVPVLALVLVELV